MEVLRAIFVAENAPQRETHERQGDHAFEPTRFVTVSHCDHCGELIWGLFGKQGLFCTECRYKCHFGCEARVIKRCKEPSPSYPPVPGLACPGVHEFVPVELDAKGLFYGDTVYCNVCRHSIVQTFGGQRCVVCGYMSHTDCKKDASADCVVPFLSQTQTAPIAEKEGNQEASVCDEAMPAYLPPAKELDEQILDGDEPKHEREFIWPHHWVEGNLAAGVVCTFCSKPINPGSKMAGFRCYWCASTVHPECLRVNSTDTSCWFGVLENIILPAFCITPYEDPSCPHRFWQIHPDRLQNTCVPLLVLINPRSGGQKGQEVLQNLKSLINPLQIFDLSNGGPKTGLQTFGALVQAGRRFAILGCGGDGTIGWICSELDKTGWPVQKMPSVAVLPLGTGNDLARALGWGGGYNGENLKKLLKDVGRAHTVMLDRWLVTVTPITDTKCNEGQVDLSEVPPGEEEKMKTYIANNYFSVGIDAKVALDFHLARESQPALFTSRGVNKLHYFKFGASAMFDGCTGLSQNLTLEVDGQEIPIPPSIEGVIVINLPSWAGGTNLWEPLEEGYQPISYSDNLIEVVGLKGAAHMGMIKISQNFISGGPLKLAQGRKVVLTLKGQAVPMQVDGEPWLQRPCQVTIVQHSQVPMLRRHLPL